MLTIAATDGPRALCEWTVVAGRGDLRVRQLELNTAGAIHLARCLDSILVPEVGEPLDPDSAAWLMLAEELPFDRGDQLPPAQLMGTQVPGEDADDRELREAATSVLHPLALRQQCRVGKIDEFPVTSGIPSGVLIRFPDVVLAFFSNVLPEEEARQGFVAQAGDTPDSFDDPDTFFYLSPAGVSLLVAVHEGLASVSMAELRSDVDAGTVEAVRRGLLDLQEGLLDTTVEFDALEGYVRLIRLFDPHGRPEPALDMPLMRLFAMAIMAMRKWMARRGRSSSEQSVTLARIREVAGCEPEWTGSDYRLLSRHAELVFELGDVAVGWLKAVGSKGRLGARPFACSAATLLGLVWVTAAHDVLEVTACAAIDEYVIGAISDPWFDPVPAIEPVIAALERIAADLGGTTAERLRQIVRAAPYRQA